MCTQIWLFNTNTHTHTNTHTRVHAIEGRGVASFLEGRVGFKFEGTILPNSGHIWANLRKFGQILSHNLGKFGQILLEKSKRIEY